MASSRRGVLIIILVLVLVVCVSAVSLFLLTVTAGAPPTVPSEAALYLKLNGPWDEVARMDLFSQLGEPSPTLRELIASIRRAKRDARVKTLVITPSVEGALWAQIQELRAAIDDFRSAGKPVVAYLEAGGPQEYYLASAANKIILMPAGAIDLSGLATYELFFRGALDKIGVYPDLLHIGDYKTASNTFTEKGFTTAHKEMSKSLNSDWFGQLVTGIAEGRKRPEAEVRKLIDSGPYLAEEAKNAGLVDVLGYEDQIDKAPPVQGTTKMDGDAYERATNFGGAFASNRIALLYAVGTIASGKSSFDSPGATVLGSDTFDQWVRKVRVDPSVRAIVVRIDSPGGSAIASDAIWRELMLARDVKPVIVSMGDVAASGGYYMAVPAHVIVAEPGTITGSIGVVTGKFVVKDTLEKLGIGVDSVSDGRLAEINSPFKPFSKDERARIESQLQSTYELFLSRVAEGRHLTTAKVDTMAQGRVWTGHQAKDLGLVDELGGLDTALQIAKQRAKIDPKSEVELVVYPAKRSLFEVLSNPLGRNADSGLSVLARPRDARIVDAALAMLRLFRRGEPLTLMPNVFVN
ncbi:MAG TPA: signal peptide peptidase SppA [Vicinamibacterales bacterium]|nr:signal peptide peptidase SppA [Vicinamibacterales bacterium]